MILLCFGTNQRVAGWYNHAYLESKVQVQVQGLKLSIYKCRLFFKSFRV